MESQISKDKVLNLISRELSRRLSLPTLIFGLSIIAPVSKVLRERDHIVICLMAGREEIVLKFSDEDTAKNEGYVINPDEFTILGEVSLCLGLRCHRNCGCGCLVDMGYVKPEDNVHLIARPGDSACRKIHKKKIQKPETETDEQLYSLKFIRQTVSDLHSAYFEALTKI